MHPLYKKGEAISNYFGPRQEISELGLKVAQIISKYAVPNILEEAEDRRQEEGQEAGGRRQEEGGRRR